MFVFIMSLALTGKKREQAEDFYDKLLKVLLKENLPFMVSGTYAYNEYTGLDRATGDIDLKTTFDAYPQVLKTLNKSGYKTELAEVEFNWLAKVYDDKGYYTDIIYAERNGLHKVEKSWFDYAPDATVLGHSVKLEPAEELIRSKCYVKNRHRDDSGDVVHLILRQGKNVNWEILVEKMKPHWELLMANIILFLFIYPSEREIIPQWVIDTLTKQLDERLKHSPTKEKITRGLLLSNDYQVGVARWGFKPITELK
jgi:hypothetical protein